MPHTLAMLKGLADKSTQDIYDGINSRQARKLPRKLHAREQRLLDQVNAALSLAWVTHSTEQPVGEIER